MEIKKTMSAAKRTAFVETVVKGCTVSGVYNPAMYDYAFRFAVVGYLSDVSVDESEDEKLSEILYSDEVTAIMTQNNPLLIGLDFACREQIRMNHEQWMVHYKHAATPNPMEQMATLLEEFLGEIKGNINPEAIMDAVLKGQEKRTAARKKVLKKAQATQPLKVVAKPAKE